MHNNLQITIDYKNGLPPYRQIINQITRAILANIYQTHDSLPSIRELSVKLGVAPLTVAKAYLHLEQLGLVKTKWGKGSFVTDNRKLKHKTRQAEIENELINQVSTMIRQTSLNHKRILKRLKKNLNMA